MAVSYNKVILAGNLTRDPQLKPVGDKNSVTNFGLAINRRYKGSDGNMNEEVTFVDVEAWGKTGELVCQYVAKGSSVLIEGRLKLDSWDDKDGQKRSKLKVVADGVQFLSFKEKAHGDAPAPAPGPRKPAAAQDDDTPFARPLIAETWG